ncbi:type II secretion system F family protein [Georgenia subflava]|uniref:Type II secretion system protein GspF domain-containing protein n=1 Tax=Georgenia subflava TaxID=1622177 RepID=A0A6N7ED94_9MICO|nr:type II secretion system F family protein [Georgenia subflava]MPV35960.1 hypothetical protein [Georgenia subflava]
MSTGLLLFMLAGGLVGLAVFALVYAFTPAQPDLSDAVARIERKRTTPPGAGATTSQESASRTVRVGNWAGKTLPPNLWVRTPERELALLRISHDRFYGEKLVFASLGLAIPPVLTMLFSLLGLRLPFTIPVIASLALAAVLFFIPNYNTIDDARRARTEFRHALVAYIDLVALERAAGAGPRQAMEAAAEVGNSWVFKRLAEDLARSRWSGVPPWDSLRALADELGLAELNDFADIMRLSGEQSTSVYANLRARADAMRSAILGEQLAEANATGERMTIPGSLLGVVFMGLLVAPAVLQMLTRT